MRRKAKGKGLVAALWLALLAFVPTAPAQPIVKAVDAVGMTVADMDRSIDLYAKVLSFEKVSDVEVWGDEYDRLKGIFGLRKRLVRMRLGEEFIDLTEFLTPKGRPFPEDSRSNDLWFQHIAIVVSDMEKAYERLRGHKVRHASMCGRTISSTGRPCCVFRTSKRSRPDLGAGRSAPSPRTWWRSRKARPVSKRAGSRGTRTAMV